MAEQIKRVGVRLARLNRERLKINSALVQLLDDLRPLFRVSTAGRCRARCGAGPRTPGRRRAPARRDAVVAAAGSTTIPGRAPALRLLLRASRSCGWRAGDLLARLGRFQRAARPRACSRPQESAAPPGAAEHDRRRHRRSADCRDAARRARAAVAGRGPVVWAVAPVQDRRAAPAVSHSAARAGRAAPPSR